MTQPSGAPPQKKKGGVALVLGIVLLVLSVVGGIGGIALGGTKIADFENQTQRVSVGSSKTLNLTAGDYTIYTKLSFSSIASDVTITDPDGKAVTKRPVSGSLSTTINGSTWYAEDDFTVTKAGNHKIEAKGDFGSPTGGSGEIIVGPSFASSVGVALGLILGGVFGGGLLFVIGLVLLIVGLVRRGKSKRPNVPMMPPTYGGPPGYGGPPAGPPGYGGPPPGPPGYGGPPAGPPPGPPGYPG